MSGALQPLSHTPAKLVTCSPVAEVQSVKAGYLVAVKAGYLAVKTGYLAVKAGYLAVKAGSEGWLPGSEGWLPGSEGWQ